jgi:hypothetical protein
MPPRLLVTERGRGRLRPHHACTRPQEARCGPATWALASARERATGARRGVLAGSHGYGRRSALVLANTGSAAETQTCSCFDVGARMRPGRRAARSEGDGSYALRLVEEHPRALAASQGARLRRGDPRRRAAAHHRRRERRRPDGRLAAARPPPSRRSARAAHRTRGNRTSRRRHVQPCDGRQPRRHRAHRRSARHPDVPEARTRHAPRLASTRARRARLSACRRLTPLLPSRAGLRFGGAAPTDDSTARGPCPRGTRPSAGLRTWPEPGLVGDEPERWVVLVAADAWGEQVG